MRDVQNISFPPQDDEEDLKKVDEFSSLEEEAKLHDLVLVLVKDAQLKLVYYENKIPSLYRGDFNAEKILAWLISERNSNSIEFVTEEMIQEDLLHEDNFVAILFLGICYNEEEDFNVCEETLEALETIDGELDEFGIDLVQTEDTEMAR